MHMTQDPREALYELWKKEWDALDTEGKINERFNTLFEHGRNLTGWLHQAKKGYVPDDDIHSYHAWLLDVTNLVHLITTPNDPVRLECDRIMNSVAQEKGMAADAIRKMYGVLDAASSQWNIGFLRPIELVIVAETFSDFLARAETYHKGNKKIEAGVLASVVLEDTVKKIAATAGLETQKRSLEELVDSLVKANIFTDVKAKQVKVYATVRNHALHAEWESLNIRDVGELIKGTQELIAEFLREWLTARQ